MGAKIIRAKHPEYEQTLSFLQRSSVAGQGQGLVDKARINWKTPISGGICLPVLDARARYTSVGERRWSFLFLLLFLYAWQVRGTENDTCRHCLIKRGYVLCAMCACSKGVSIELKMAGYCVP